MYIEGKKEEIWLSPMTIASTPINKTKKQRDNTKRHKKFDYTIADRLRMVIWGNDSQTTGVVKPELQNS